MQWCDSVVKYSVSHPWEPAEGIMEPGYMEHKGDLAAICYQFTVFLVREAFFKKM